MNEWKGKKVLVLGLGQYEKGSGVTAALFVAKHGADVLVSDLKKEKDIAGNVKRLKRYTNVRFRLGEHRLGDIRWADVIFRNPRVRPDSPEMRLASKLGKRVESDVSVFMKRCPCPIIGITGTRGKSTTAMLVAGMLKRSGKRAWLGGNILISPLSFLTKVKQNDVVVLELSSWQLEVTGAAGISPGVACITNLMRDHLNTYAGMDEYGEAKAQIFRHQKPGDVLVLNGDDAWCRSKVSEAPWSVRLFTARKSPKSEAWIEDDRLVMRSGATKTVTLGYLNQLKVYGQHNLMNMLAAACTAKMAGARFPALRRALREFKGLPHRQEIVAVKHGVTYVNDTTATTPDGTIAALRALGPRFKTLHLILGGADKELEFAGLAREIRRHRVNVVVLPGTAHRKLTTDLRSHRITYADAPTLKDAVAVTRRHAKKGDAVVLSPGCASFGLFANEFERGEAFRKLARA